MNGHGDPGDLGDLGAVEALARLDAQVAAGTLDVVEYWRLRAEIESGLPADLAPPEAPAPRSGDVELVPPAPSLPTLPTLAGPGAVPPPVPQAPSRRPDAAPSPVPPAAVPGEDAPFAPPSGAVNLQYRAQPQAPQRRWWEWWRR